jgi:agmatine/peptidylarginine deiminase
VFADLPLFSSPFASCVWVINVTRPLPPPAAVPCFSCRDGLDPSAAVNQNKQKNLKTLKKHKGLQFEICWCAA